MLPSFSKILHISRSSMLARFTDLDVVSHNLSNVNTVGYKRSRSNFQELLDIQTAPDDISYNGVRVEATQHLFDQGGLQVTGNSLDLAISGEGFFAVTLADGRTAYTRDGQFFLDEGLNIVTADGNALDWTGAIPPDTLELAVQPDGTVMVFNGTDWNQAGTIGLTRFTNPSGLFGYGDNLWLESDASGAPQAGAAAAPPFGEIVGSALEMSNVNMAEEMTQMVTLQRSYEISMRVFQNTDQMMIQAIRMRR